MSSHNQLLLHLQVDEEAVGKLLVDLAARKQVQVLGFEVKVEKPPGTNRPRGQLAPQILEIVKAAGPSGIKISDIKIPGSNVGSTVAKMVGGGILKKVAYGTYTINPQPKKKAKKRK